MFTGGGTVVARYDYDPYGRSITVLGTTLTDFNFTGLYRHSKSNLDLAVYRAYDPDLGRWLNRDPIAETGGLNLYGYVENNPVRHVDPLGLISNESGQGPGRRPNLGIPVPSSFADQIQCFFYCLPRTGFSITYISAERIPGGTRVKLSIACYRNSGCEGKPPLNRPSMHP
jgi:RHS repeat-associated protein